MRNFGKGKRKLGVILLILLSWTALFSQNPPPDEWNITPINSSIPGKPSLYRLSQPDGTKIWVATDTTIPMVTLVAAYPKGTLHQTQLGTAHIWANAIPFHNPDFATPQEAEQWQKQQGWRIETHLKPEYMLLRMRVPREDWRKAIYYINQLEARSPYTPAELEFAKQKSLQRIQTAEMDPWYNFQQEMNEALCLEENKGILNTVGNYAQLRKLEPAEVNVFAEGAALCGLWIAGDISPDSVLLVTLPNPATTAPLPLPDLPYVNGSFKKTYSQMARDGYWIRVENNWASQTVMEYVYQLRESGGPTLTPELEQAFEILPVALSLPGNDLYDTLIGKGLALNLQWRYEPGLHTASWHFTVVPKPDQSAACAKAIFNLLEGKIRIAPETWKNAVTIIRLLESNARTKTSDWIMEWASREMTRPEYNPAKYPKALENIPQEEIEKVLQQLLGPFSDARGVIYGTGENPQMFDEDPMIYGETKASGNVIAKDWSGLLAVEASKVYFKANKPEPDEPSMERIERVATWLKQYPDAKIYVNGYTDGVGDGVKNYHLSIERADLVMRILSEGYGIASSRMEVRGYGEAFPDYPDDIPEHRALNRRVTFTIKKDTE